MTKEVVITFRMDRDEVRRLDQIATSARRTRSNVLRLLLELAEDQKLTNELKRRF